jgi:hypothetical protein
VSVLLALVACTSSAFVGVGHGPDATPEDAGGATPPDPEEEDAGSYELDDSWVFSNDLVHTVAITIDDSGVAALTADPYTAVPATVTYDGYTVPDVGVRLRGKIGSFRTLAGKPKFKIDFDAFVEDQRFWGLERLNLNNSVVDCSYLKEPLGYHIFDLAGVPALRTAFATVTVNGADYGLYVVVEGEDARFLARHFPDATGNLYDGKYVWYGGYNYTLLDFDPTVQDLFQLEHGVDVGHADIHGVTTALDTDVGTADFYAGVGAVVDWDEYQHELAVEQWIGHLDGYAMNRNNYRVYFDPADGKARILPWDLDYAFLDDYQWGMSWASPSGRLAAGCWQDATCVAAQSAAVQDVAAVADPDALVAFLDTLDALTTEAAALDPRRECAAADVPTARDQLRAWVQAKPAAMAEWWHY